MKARLDVSGIELSILPLLNLINEWKNCITAGFLFIKKTWMMW